MSFIPEENNVIAGRFLTSAWNRGEFLEELIAPDAIDHSYIAGKAVTQQGNENFRTIVTTFRKAMPNLKLEIDDEVYVGNKVVHRWTLSGTDTNGLMDLTPTGQNVLVTGTTIVRLLNGKIVERWSSVDEFSLLLQLGIAYFPAAPEDVAVADNAQPVAGEKAEPARMEPVSSAPEEAVYEEAEPAMESTMIFYRSVVSWRLVPEDSGSPIQLKDQMRAGRSAENQIHIDHPSVSRVHAEFEVKGEECWLTDLDSSNGTFVNKVKIQGPTRLKDLDIVSLGPTISFKIEASESLVG